MNEQQRTQCESAGERDAEIWIQDDAPHQYVKALPDVEGLFTLKKKLDKHGGWWGLMRSRYPELCESSKCLARTDTTEQERHAWSLGFERRAIEIAKRRMEW